MVVGAAAQATTPSGTRGRQVAEARCQACHGLDGQAPSPEVPRLAGQVPEFLALQLRNYRSGERPHPVMAPLAKGLTDAQVTDVSAYYAGLPPMRGTPAGGASPEVLALGESIFRRGKPGVSACQHCHGPQGHGLPPVFARLAGQHARFVVASLQPYRQLDDFRNPYAFVMKAAVQNLSDAEIEAVALYVETLH